jgi:hypothetical protein
MNDSTTTFPLLKNRFQKNVGYIVLIYKPETISAEFLSATFPKIPAEIIALIRDFAFPRRIPRGDPRYQHLFYNYRKEMPYNIFMKITERGNWMIIINIRHRNTDGELLKHRLIIDNYTTPQTGDNYFTYYFYNQSTRVTNILSTVTSGTKR